ncbi:MAG: HAD family hydrolase [Desulfosarcinaceae bacterium]
MAKAIFLDRDGILNKDVGFISHRDQIQVLPAVPDALNIFESLGYILIVVTNQAAAARGIVTEKTIQKINRYLCYLLFKVSKVRISRFYYCPHHPNADLKRYRIECECRKPKPGMLIKAAREYKLELSTSYMIGDRPSDIAAGNAAGCCSILVKSGRHNDPAIVSPNIELNKVPHHTCDNLMAAAIWIQETERTAMA